MILFWLEKVENVKFLANNFLTRCLFLSAGSSCVTLQHICTEVKMSNWGGSVAQMLHLHHNLQFFPPSPHFNHNTNKSPCQTKTSKNVPSRFSSSRQKHRLRTCRLVYLHLTLTFPSAHQSEHENRLIARCGLLIMATGGSQLVLNCSQMSRRRVCDGEHGGEQHTPHYWSHKQRESRAEGTSRLQ